MTTTILIPGLLCDAIVWQPLMAATPDALVADLSTQDNLTTMAQDCLAMAEGTLAVAGHSMGARVALEMARLAPERIERLVLMDTGIHPLKDGETEKRDAIIAYAYAEGMQALADKWLPGMVYAPNQQNEPLMQSLTDMVLRKDADLHKRQITALVNRPDASAYLADISCPVLLVVGREDQWSPVAQHEDMQRLLENSRLEIIDNAGHFAPVEQPDDVVHVVAPFLNASITQGGS